MLDSAEQAFSFRVVEGLFDDPCSSALTEDADFELRTSGRYAQSSDYIRTLAAEHGFTIATEDHITVRIELDAPVAGSVFVLDKAGLIPMSTR